MLLRDLKLSRFICKFIINEITRTVKVGNDLLRVYRGLHLTSLYSYMYDHINVLNELYSKLQKKKPILIILNILQWQKYQVDLNYALIIK